MREDAAKVEWNCQTSDVERYELGGRERGGWSESGEKRKEEAGKNEKKL